MNTEDLRRDLIKAIEKGLEADAAKKFLLEVIHNHRSRVYADLESPNSIYYQKIDNSPMVVPQSELMVLRKMENAISDAIAEGEEARKRLLELDTPRSEPHVGLRF